MAYEVGCTYTTDKPGVTAYIGCYNPNCNEAPFDRCYVGWCSDYPHQYVFWRKDGSPGSDAFGRLMNKIEEK